MKKYSKVLSIFISVVIFAVSLTSCKNSNDKSDSVTDNSIGGIHYIEKKEKKDFALKATPFDILVGENTSVLFSAACNLSSTDNINPAIYDEDNNFITYLYDNGQNGDEKANDKIYSAKCNLYSDTEKHVNYYVFCNNKISSNEKDIFFYKNFTEKELTEATNFELELAEIDSKYMKSNEYIKEKDINSYLTEICNLCEKQKDIVKSYDYDKSNNSVYIELTSGMTYLIVPPIEGRLAGGKPKEIVTFEPNKTSIQTSFAKLMLGEKYYSTYDNANKIKEFDSNFTYNDNNQFENDEVTIDVLKNLSPFSVMIWNGHGCYNKKKNIVVLMTSTELPSPTFMDKYSSYVADIKDKRILKGGGLDYLDGMSSCGITSKFIDAYFPQLDEAIIYLGACNSLANWSFGESLTLKGASAIYGYNISITVEPEAQIRTRLFNDLCSISEITKDYNTVEEAYYSNYNDSISEHGFSMYYNNSSKRLLDKKTNVKGSISGTVKDSETKKPIKGVKVEIIDNKSDDLTSIVTVTTDKEGKFNTKLIPYGEYSISFSHDDYGFYGTTLDIYEDNVVLTEPVLLKKINKTLTEADLLNYYWENNIQSPKIYEFTNDGIVIEYDGNLKYSVDKSTWYECRRFKYSLSDDKLVLNWNGETNLRYITKKENINWDKGLKFYNEINDTDYFFYQTDFVRTGAPSENAMYLIKSLPKEKIVDTSSILDIKTNERFNKTEIIQKLELHYNSLPNITGTYSITDIDDSETELKACLRYSMSNKEAEEIISNGGFPIPYKLVACITVDKTTGLVTEDTGGSWSL